MPEPQLILQLSGKSWMGGVAIQKYMPLGGLFKDATNFDPFEESGIWIPTYAGTRRGTNQILKQIRVMVDFVNTSDSNTPYFYGFCHLHEVYKVKTVTPFTVISETPSMTGVGWTNIRGGARYKSNILYATDTSVFTGTTIPMTAQSSILAGLESGFDHIMDVGPDRNLYVTNKNHVSRITALRSGANTAQYLSFEDDVRLRDLTNDGKYEIFIGDTNTTPSSITGNIQGSNRCFVAFWNMRSQDLTQIWEFKDGQLYAVETIEDDVIVFGADNVYLCSINSRPVPIIPFRKNSVISSVGIVQVNPNNVVKVGSGIVLFSIGSTIYGYGRPNPYVDRILFKVNTEANNNNISALYHTYAASDSIPWASSDGNRLYDYGNGTTRNSSVLKLTDVDFKRPYRFAYAKVFFRAVLTTGQSVDLVIRTANSARDILTSRTVSHTADGAIFSYIFYPQPNVTPTSQTHIFENMTDFEITNTAGVEVIRLEVWAYPLPSSQITKF